MCKGGLVANNKLNTRTPFFLNPSLKPRKKIPRTTHFLLLTSQHANRHFPIRNELKMKTIKENENCQYPWLKIKRISPLKGPNSAQSCLKTVTSFRALTDSMLMAPPRAPLIRCLHGFRYTQFSLGFVQKEMGGLNILCLFRRD